MRNLAISIFAGILLASCSLTPKLEVKPVEIPAIKSSTTADFDAINIKWWKGFANPELEKLIAEALKHNSDLLKAASNISISRATLGASNAELYPQLGIQGSGVRRANSRESLPRGGSRIANNFSLSGILSFELDLWGRLRDAKNAHEALLHANEANFETIKLALVAGVAESYFRLLTLIEQRNILQASVDSYQKSYEYRLKQYEVGAINEILLEQARYQLEHTKAQLLAYERQESEALTALAILLGRAPKDIMETHIASTVVAPNIPEVPEGIPSDLLKRRSDVKSAYERLKAANYSIGVSRASYFPSISLSGASGYQSAELSNLLSRPAETWSVGGNLAMPLLNFGRTSAQVESAKAQKEIAEIDYFATVRRAFGEVKDALKQREIVHKRLISLTAQERAHKRIVEIFEKRFESGYSSHLELLEAQRQNLATCLQLSSVKLENLTSIITLYKALGGGWKDKMKRE